MYLKNIKLWNFRKFGSSKDEIDITKPDLIVSFNKGFNLIIGENDSGKTAVIDAIKILLKTKSIDWIKLENDDFYINSNHLRIECIFDNLTDEECINFPNFLDFKDSEGVAKESPILRVFLNAERVNNKILPFNIKAGPGDGYILEADMREYLEVVYLKPLRDAENELVPKRNSRLSQILLGNNVFKDKDDNHELVAEFIKFNSIVKDYFDNNNKDGYQIKNKIDEFLEQFFGVKKLSNFEITKQKLKDILETLRIELADYNPGLGSSNMLFIASELLNLQENEYDGLKLGLIEEIEAHLHPQAQLRIINSLQEKCEKSNLQLILTTHSPNIASKIKLDNILFSNNNSIFSLKRGETNLNNNDYLFLEKFLDVTKCNLFFASGLIFVEGWAEEILIPSIAKKIGIDLVKSGVSIINVGGVSFLNYTKIFLRKNPNENINIPISIITDLDIPIDSADKDTEEKNKIMSIEKKLNCKNIKVFISKEWTLEYCLYKSKSLSEIFIKSCSEIHKKSLKNFNEEKFISMLKEKRIKKTKIAYLLSSYIESTEIESLENDEYIKYIINSIKYASGKNNN